MTLKCMVRSATPLKAVAGASASRRGGGPRAWLLLPALLLGCATSSGTEAGSAAPAGASTVDGGGESGQKKATSGVMPIYQRTGEGDSARVERVAPLATPVQSASPTGSLLAPEEKHLRNVRQLTDGGENAEAYFSFDGKRLSFQSRRAGAGCDRIYTMAIDGSDVQQISSGEGTTTCSYYTPDGRWVVYASTHLGGPACPPRPDMSEGYVWALYQEYDIFKKNLETGEVVRLTHTPGYDAEATISPDGKRMVFTSVRDGDLELYTMDLEGKDVRRITRSPGYDGGAFFSHDSRKLVWRASRPTGKDLQAYQALLEKGLVRPTALEIVVGNEDGSEARAITANGKANFAPYFLPDDSGVLFSSNHHDPDGRNFDIFLVSLSGGTPEQITFDPSFDGFPMFSRDGKQLVFSSNRRARVRGETNVFIAEWVP